MSILIYVLDALCEKDNEDSNETDTVITSISLMIEETKAFQLSHNFKALTARRKIMANDIKSAEEWLDTQMSENPTLYGIYADFTSSRAYLAIGKYDQAIILLKRVSRLASEFNRPLDLIEASILLSIACWKKKASLQNEALDYLEYAVNTAYPYGHIQMFVNDGAALAGMLYKLLSRAQRTKQQEENDGLHSFTKLLYMKTRVNHNKELSQNITKSPVKFTDKQKAVAHLLCQGKSYRIIAEELGIQISGLRTHLRSIYNKLDVTNGVDAVTKINAMKLLD